MNRKARRQATKAARKGPSADTAEASVSELQRTLTDAAKHRVAGRLAESEALYRRVFKADPEQPVALHWLGVLAHTRGQNEAALDLLERAASLSPADPLCLFHLGEIRRAVGRYEGAVDSYRQALACEPGMTDIRFGLGSALLELGHAGEAASELRRAIELCPDDAEAHNNLANALAELGELDAAIEQYRSALKIRPGYAETHMNLGLALVEKELDEEAVTRFRRAVEIDPRLEGAWLKLILCLLRLEQTDAAYDTACQAVRLHPDYAEAYDALGQCLSKQGRLNEALEAYRKAVEIRPDFAEAHFNVGVCLQSEGRFAEASKAHARALELRPDLAEAEYNLAAIEDGQSRDDQVTRLDALLSLSEIPDRERINASFALAKIHEARGDVDAAFDLYRRGNEIKARNLPFDPGRHLNFIDRLIATFDGAFFSTRRSFGQASPLPVFVLGMPRSGTTLVEQILASHPAVHGAGELDEMRQMVRTLPERLGTTTTFPDCAKLMDRALSQQLAEGYLDSLRERGPGVERVTDKMTGNYLRLGLIALLLPEAWVIHCRRSPLDTCLSCYFQNFAHGLSFSYDLRHLGLVYRQYIRLMEHWHRFLPLPILDVQYENLVADQEAQSRRIVEFCDLPWDETCLHFHEQQREVRTASFWQVRQPLYTDSAGRWRAYADHIGPLIHRLGELATSES